MPEIITRAGKGSELTHNELDANFKRTVTQKTTTYQVLTSDNRATIEGNHATTGFTVTLPTVADAAAVDTSDFEVTVTNINAAEVSVDGSGAETIDGSTTPIILQQWDSITIGLDSAQTAWKTLSTKSLGFSMTGAVMPFATDTAPAGWLECDGSTISRTAYARLFAVTGTVFGIGDGSTTFEIPDLRGQFIRGYDNGAGTDPDAASRTDSGDGSTTGDNVGTKQADENQAHTHTTDSQGTHDHDLQTWNVASGVGFEAVENAEMGHDSSVGVTEQLDVITSSGAHTHTAQSDGGSESRPTNVSLMYCIKT